MERAAASSSPPFRHSIVPFSSTMVRRGRSRTMIDSQPRPLVSRWIGSIHSAVGLVPQPDRPGRDSRPRCGFVQLDYLRFELADMRPVNGMPRFSRGNGSARPPRRGGPYDAGHVALPTPARYGSCPRLDDLCCGVTGAAFCDDIVEVTPNHLVNGLHHSLTVEPSSRPTL